MTLERILNLWGCLSWRSILTRFPSSICCQCHHNSANTRVAPVRFRFRLTRTVRAVPVVGSDGSSLEKGFFWFNTVLAERDGSDGFQFLFQGSDGSGSSFGFLTTVPTVPVSGRRRAEYGFGEYGLKHRAQWFFFGPHRVPGRELSEFLSAYYSCAKADSPRFSQNSACLPQNSVSCLFRNSTLETALFGERLRGNRDSSNRPERFREVMGSLRRSLERVSGCTSQRSPGTLSETVSQPPSEWHVPLRALAPNPVAPWSSCNFCPVPVSGSSSVAGPSCNTRGRKKQ